MVLLQLIDYCFLNNIGEKNKIAGYSVTSWLDTILVFVALYIVYRCVKKTPSWGNGDIVIQILLALFCSLPYVVVKGIMNPC